MHLPSYVVSMAIGRCASPLVFTAPKAPYMEFTGTLIAIWEASCTARSALADYKDYIYYNIYMYIVHRSRRRKGSSTLPESCDDHMIRCAHK
eukprot:6194153-Pleurochrysis_carterae.AAC.7